MRLESKKYLYDVLQAVLRLQGFAAGKSFENYQHDALLRAGVERQLEIVGEALNQLTRIDPETAARIGEHRRIIAFRNILIHGYAEVDDRVVWNVVELKLPVLLREVQSLLDEPEGL
jgi:uncharacterized protein with HEPN domain